MYQPFSLLSQRILLPVFFLAILQTACVSIKPSTVQLSNEVGQRLSEMEKIHHLALSRYFDMEQQRVEEFLTNTWEPLFLKNFLGTSNILSLLQQAPSIAEQQRLILKEGIALYLDDKAEADRAAKELFAKLSDSRKGEEEVVKTVLTRYIDKDQLNRAVVHINRLLLSEDPARIIFEFTEAAHQQMQAQRKEMLAPILAARMEALASLSASYAELIRGQSTITGRLQAAARRSKQQDELLNQLKLNPSEALVDKMTSITSKVNRALSVAQSAANAKKEGSTNDALKAIKDALSQ